MKAVMKSLLTLVLVLSAVTFAEAQAAGNWQRVHGQVQGIQGNQMTFRDDGGRMLVVDMAQVSESVRHALAPNAPATLVGFPGTEANRFTARYIIQDNAGRAAATAPAGTPTTVNDRVVPLIPQFIGSKEFQDLRAGLQTNQAAAQMLVTQIYQGFLERAPNIQERQDWAGFLVQTGDLKGVTEYVVRSPEYTKKNKDEQQVIRDLYEGLLGRSASPDEVQTWQGRLVQK